MVLFDSLGHIGCSITLRLFHNKLNVPCCKFNIVRFIDSVKETVL